MHVSFWAPIIYILCNHTVIILSCFWDIQLYRIIRIHVSYNHIIQSYYTIILYICIIHMYPNMILRTHHYTIVLPKKFHALSASPKDRATTEAKSDNPSEPCRYAMPVALLCCTAGLWFSTGEKITFC